MSSKNADPIIFLIWISNRGLTKKEIREQTEFDLFESLEKRLNRLVENELLTKRGEFYFCDLPF